MKFSEASPALRAYVECAIWSSTDIDTSEPLDKKYSGEDLSEQALDKMNKDLTKFFEAYYNLIEYSAVDIEADSEQVSHDFWLNRNGHGAGFWDRPNFYGNQAIADKLSDLAHSFGEADLLPNEGTLEHFPA